MRPAIPDADHFPLAVSSSRRYVSGGFIEAIFLL
jgi:hypothetical protein